MKFIAVLCALVVALTGCSLNQKPERTQTADFKQLRAAVKALKTDAGDGFCSGVLIDRRTILTAAHCDIGKDIYVNGYRAFIVKKDEKRDLMMLHLPVGTHCPCVPNAVENPARDAEVFVVGFPLDAGQVLTEGRFQSKGENGFILFTAPVTWGNSGGGVFVRTEHGWALIGIVSHGTIVPVGFIPIVIGHLNYAAGATSIVEFILGV